VTGSRANKKLTTRQAAHPDYVRFGYRTTKSVRNCSTLGIRTRKYSAAIHRHGAMQLETSKKCVSYARDADVRAARRSRAPMNLSERETQPNSAWITRSDAS